MTSKIVRESRRLRTRLALVVLVAFGVGGALAAAGVFSGPASASGSSTTDGSSSFLTLLQATYGILGETTATSETAIPASYQDRPGFQQAVQRLGLEVSAARMATAPGGLEMWLILGTGGFSVPFADPGAGWAFRSQAPSLPPDGFIGTLGTNADGTYTAAVFVPNGNTTVRLTDATGATTVVDVTDNAFALTTGSGSGGIVQIQGKGIDGSPVTAPTTGP